LLEAGANAFVAQHKYDYRDSVHAFLGQSILFERHFEMLVVDFGEPVSLGVRGRLECLTTNIGISLRECLRC